MQRLGAELHDWLGAFWNVVTSPRRETFIELGEVADGKWKGLIVWLVIIAVLAYAVANAQVPGGMLPSTLFILILLFPIGVLTWVTLIHLGYQRLFGRKKDRHAELLYVVGSISVIASIGNLAVSLVPVVGTAASYVEMLWGAVLVVLATRAITRLNMWWSIGVVVVASIGSLVAMALLALFLAGLTSTNSQLFRP